MKSFISGLDQLQREFENLAKTAEALDGDIAHVSFDPDDPASIAAAIAQVEAAIDAKAGPDGGRGMSKTIVDGLKEQARASIMERVAQARLEGDSHDGV